LTIQIPQPVCAHCGGPLLERVDGYAAAAGWMIVLYCPPCKRGVIAHPRVYPTPQAAQWAVDSGEWR
jgi:hypothetical protein